MKKNIIVMALLLILFSCSPGKVYEKHVKLENLAWNRFNTISFDIGIKDVGPSYDVYAAIRHITDIPYPDIDVSAYLLTPYGETRSRELTIALKDREGKNLGDGLGELWDVQALIWEGLEFREPGIYSIDLSSAMQQLDVIGVLEVGLVVKKAGE